jgi:hypothetical protein
VDLQHDITKELNCSASLYAGWNSEKLTQEQFDEAEERLRNFPAQALAKKVSNTNLHWLRKKLFDLKIHSKLMGILRRQIRLN